jgi:hypothetical protein
MIKLVPFEIYLRIIIHIFSLKSTKKKHLFSYFRIVHYIFIESILFLSTKKYKKKYNNT